MDGSAGKHTIELAFGGLKRLTESASTCVSGLESFGGKGIMRVTLNKAVDFSETSIEDTSGTRDEVDDSDFFEAGDSGLAAELSAGQHMEECNQDSHGTSVPSNESRRKLVDSHLSDMKSLEQVGRAFPAGFNMKVSEVPSALERSSEEKRLGASNLFVAKMHQSKRLKTGLSLESKERRDAQPCLADEVFPSSQLELSTGIPSMAGREEATDMTSNMDLGEWEHQQLHHKMQVIQMNLPVLSVPNATQ